MKTISKILVILAIVVLVAPGCKKLLDVDFLADFVSSFDIGPTTAMKNFSFSDTYILDPETNSEYSKYADKIKGVKVLSITGKVTSISSPVTLTNTVIQVSKEGFTTVNFAADNIAIFQGFEYTYSDTDNQFKNLEAILKDPKPITITYSGVASEEGVTFTYELTFETKVTANPLN
jgi:hypothetical protein